MTAHSVQVPESFRRMPRWSGADHGWLDALPDLVQEHCARWNLRLERGEVWHGSNALVLPVYRGELPLALRLTPPDDPVAEQVTALRFWAGRGTVELLDADVDAGVMLLERLDPTRSLAGLPLAEAVPLIAAVMTRLAVPAPAEAPSTAALAAARCGELEADWQALGRPFPRQHLNAALEAAAPLSRSPATAAANGDLHYDQVLTGRREPWLVVDPILLRGDIEYDLARLLWTRLDEMPSATAIRGWFDLTVAEAGLDAGHAWAWVVFRTVDYWLWGLANGLTEDPVRCARLLAAFL
ncbi:MAG: kinase [Propionibacteriaceae bacterium]|nr:kinase [Propionibacteriaceae bacterium]